MTDYVKITDYAAKDNLLTGDPNKVVRGSEIGADFDAVATAVATKADEDGATLTNVTVSSGSISGVTLALKQSATPTPTAEGDIQWDTDDNNIKVGDGAATQTFQASPAATTDNAIARFDGTTGKLQNSAVTIADTTGDIATSGFISVGAGAAATPVITTSGDANTGLFFPAADTVAVATGGSERMRIDTSGNVGIGRTSSAAIGIATKSSSTYLLDMKDGSDVSVLTLWGSGQLLLQKPEGLGYGTGAGGTVTQATSRTTGVTINKPTGSITMFTAAGTASWNGFTVNNSLVAATDTVVLSIRSGVTNSYQIQVIDIAAGSFRILFATTGGTASDTPVINFAIIKGATS